MDPNLFLVARVESSNLTDISWLVSENEPYELTDPIDFLDSEEIQEVFQFYKQSYEPIGSLNINEASQLLEYNRWILIIEDAKMVAFAVMKTTYAGIKLCLLGTNGSTKAKSAIKKLIRNGLNVDGVYGEVSGGVERAVIGHVPEIPPTLAEKILRKNVSLDKDERHYYREITNVGRKRKILVGKPLIW